MITLFVLAATVVSTSPPGMEGTRAGQERSDNGLQLTLCWCPAGNFTMGSPESEADRNSDETAHRVTLTRGFWLGKYEMTQAEYKALMGANPSYFSSTGKGSSSASGMNTDRFPVENVSWEDAIAYCKKLTVQERAAGRLPADWEYTLPTEAQWEYACRAGTSTPFWLGSSLNGSEADCDGNYPYGTSGKGDYLQRTTTVGSYRANAFGLYDVHGNVWEWCLDAYDEKFYSSTAGQYDDPKNVDYGLPVRVARGGSWSDDAWLCRSAYRIRGTPGIRDSNLGFRVALVSGAK